MPIPLQLLLVEDSADDTDFILRALGRGGYDPACTRVETADAMAGALKDQPWDLVISDYALPHFSGPEALRLLRASGRDLPFIVVSGAIGEETAAAIMKAGAHDYVMKSNLARLAPAVERELREAVGRLERRRLAAEREQLVSELQAALAQVKRLSGLLPICAGCKKIRDGQGDWSQVETYIQKHSEASFTHGLCPDCIKKFYPGLEEDDPGDSPKEAV
ncbi:MAG: response regulator [Verrucomicrobia bacterium]|nr:response regulator [Verrucomicrobiota bacterium]